MTDSRMRKSVWVGALIALAALSVSAEPQSESARAAQQHDGSGNVDSELPATCVRQVPSPDGRYVAADCKAKDGYHDTIWLRDVTTGATADLLAPDDATWPGSGATRTVAWLDDDWILYTTHCGTDCTSLEVVNIGNRAHRYFCLDGGFNFSPDMKHAVGESDNPYGPGDKRGGLAVIPISVASASPTRQSECEGTIPGCNAPCSPGERQKLRWVKFKRWSRDSKSFSYILRVCVDGRWGAKKKRVFQLK